MDSDEQLLRAEAIDDAQWALRAEEVERGLERILDEHDEDEPVGVYRLVDGEDVHVVPVYASFGPRFRHVGDRRVPAGRGWEFYVMEDAAEVPPRLLPRLPEPLRIEWDEYDHARRDVARPHESVEDWTELLDRR